MDAKKKKIVLLIVVAVCVALLIVWLVTRPPKQEGYEYEGYVISILPEGKDFVLTTLNADGQSEYRLKKSSTKEMNNGGKTVAVGDYIQLNTTRRSETDIKNCLIFNAYSSKGKIVNVEGEDTPFLLVTTETNTLRMFKVLTANGSAINLPTGTPVKIYFQYELNNASTQVVADVVYPLSDTTSPLTEGELFHIVDVQNYTLAGSTAE